MAGFRAVFGTQAGDFVLKKTHGGGQFWEIRESSIDGLVSRLRDVITNMEYVTRELELMQQEIERIQNQDVVTLTQKDFDKMVPMRRAMQAEFYLNYVKGVDTHPLRDIVMSADDYRDFVAFVFSDKTWTEARQIQNQDPMFADDGEFSKPTVCCSGSIGEARQYGEDVLAIAVDLSEWKLVDGVEYRKEGDINLNQITHQWLNPGEGEEFLPNIPEGLTWIYHGTKNKDVIEADGVLKGGNNLGDVK